MRNSKHGLKALVLSMMAALGVMAFAATAQAQHSTELHALALHAATLNTNPLSDGGSAGTFSINLSGVLLAELAAKQISETGELLVAARNLVVRCTGFSLGAGSHLNTTTDAKVNATFTGCVSLSHDTLEPLSGCEFKELGTIKAEALVLAKLHGGQLYILFEPVEKEGEDTFSVPSYKGGQGCVLPLNNPITGSLVARVDAEEAVKQLVLFDEAIQLLLGDVLKYGSALQTAYVKGHAEVELVGVHKEDTLGVH
jgi:hypothetical protein